VCHTERVQAKGESNGEGEGHGLTHTETLIDASQTLTLLFMTHQKIEPCWLVSQTTNEELLVVTGMGTHGRLK